MTLLLALRGFAAVAVLTELAGGIPRIAQAALALGAGVWSALLVGGAAPVEPAWAIAAHELAIGASLGVIAALPLVAASAAGRLVDVAAWGQVRGPYERLFGVLAAAVFVAIDGHVAVLTAIVESHRAVPAFDASRASVLSAIGALVPAAVRLAVPWLVTSAVVTIAAGAGLRLAGRVRASIPAAAGAPAALAMMTAALVGTLAVALAALFRGI